MNFTKTGQVERILHERRLTTVGSGEGRGTPTSTNAGVTGIAAIAVSRERNAVTAIMIAGLVAGVREI